MRQLVYALPFAALVFILPFPGTVAFRLLCLALAFIYAGLAWRRLHPPPVPAKLSIVLWAALAALSVGYSFDIDYSLSELKNELGYTMMAYLAFFAFAKGERELRILVAALLAAAAVISAWGLLNTIRTGVWQETAPHGGAAGVSAFLCVAAPLLGIAFVASGEKRARLALGLGLLLLVLAALATRQRIMLPVLLLQAVLGTLLLRWSGALRVSWRAILLGLGAATVLSAVGLAGVQAWREDTGATTPTDTRRAAWPAVVERVAREPWQGAGFGRQAMRKAYPELVPKDYALFWHGHNMFLNAAISMGVPGALALLLVFANFAAIYARLIRSADERARLIGVAGILLLVGVIGRNLTNDFFVRDGALLFWSLNGALLGAGLRLQRGPDRRA